MNKQESERPIYCSSDMLNHRVAFKTEEMHSCGFGWMDLYFYKYILSSPPQFLKMQRVLKDILAHISQKARLNCLVVKEATFWGESLCVTRCLRTLAQPLLVATDGAFAMMSSGA